MRKRKMYLSVEDISVSEFILALEADSKSIDFQKKLSKKACKKFFEKCSEKIPVNLQEAAAMPFP